MPSKKEKLPLSVTHPELAKEASGWDVNQYVKFSEKLNWCCPSNHVYEATITNRVRGRGCPFCAGVKILEGFNDLLTTNPGLSKEADGWNPRLFSKGSDARLSWKCAHGHKWEAIVSSRAGKKSRGCPYCAGQELIPGQNDLGSKFSEIAAEAHGWNPTEYFPTSNKIVEWKCSLGHVWESNIRDRTSKLTGCTVCSGRMVLVGFNDLESKFPKIAAEADGWDPKRFTAGNPKKFKWKCSAGHRWQASINNRTYDENNCPTCAISGFDPNLPGYLYFLEHPLWLMFQIGISNYPDQRIKSHKKLGWELVELRGPMDGHLTQQWETAILRMLKAKGADLSNKKIAGKFDGYSEAWSKSTFEVKSIKELMRLTEEYEESKDSASAKSPQVKNNDQLRPRQ
jgi:Probable Zinc-ribbon domain